MPSTRYRCGPSAQTAPRTAPVQITVSGPTSAIVTGRLLSNGAEAKWASIRSAPLSISSKACEPIAIIKDTSIHTRKGFSAEELEAEWNDLEQQMEKLGKATGKSLEEVKNFSYVMKNKVPDWLTQQQFDRLKRLSKQVDELFVKLDLLGEKDLIPEITSADVLKQYKVHKVPVYELPARFQE